MRILLYRRWLLVGGAVLNGLVIVSFILAWQARPALLFSPGELLTRAGPLLLEVALL